MERRYAMLILVDLTITVASAIAAIAIFPVLLVKFGQLPIPWFCASAAAVALRVAIFLFADLALRIETTFRVRLLCWLMVHLLVMICVSLAEPEAYVMALQDHLMLNILILSLIMARNFMASPPPTGGGPELTPKEKEDVLRECGATYEFGGRFIYAGLPVGDDNAEAWQKIEQLRATGSLGRSWTIPAERVPGHVRSRNRSSEFFKVFRVKLP